MNTIKQQNPFRIAGDWDLKSKLLRRRFPQLTFLDLKIENNDENDLLERIGNRLNKNRDEVIQIIKKTVTNKFINNLKIQYHE